jgi:phospholipid-transporting ATPase
LGFQNYFSGQYLYDPYIYQLFNIIFASFPIIWFGIYDKEVSYDVLVRNGRYYTQGIINKLFHNKRFWKWVLYGIIQALFIFIYSLKTCIYISDGHLHSLESQGTIAYSGVVLIANIKILTTTSTHTVISFGLFIISVLSYYLIVFLMSFYYEFFNFNTFTMMFNSFQFYLSTLYLIVLCTVIDKGIDKFCRIFGIILDPLNIDVNKFEHVENYKEMSIIRDELNNAKNKLRNVFTGSAFTFSNNNELKAAMESRRSKLENNI